jgi:hypothetical protein
MTGGYRIVRDGVLCGTQIVLYCAHLHIAFFSFSCFAFS